MSYRSIDEIQNFSFDDCEIHGYSEAGNCINFDLEALIVNENNSQNSNFTKSYAGTARMMFKDAVLLKGYKAGYKRYNANNELEYETEDETLSTNEVNTILKELKSKDVVYLCSVEKKESPDSVIYVLEIEIPDENEIAPDIFDIEFKAENVVVTWDIYLNRVQK